MAPSYNHFIYLPLSITVLAQVQVSFKEDFFICPIIYDFSRAIADHIHLLLDFSSSGQYWPILEFTHSHTTWMNYPPPIYFWLPIQQPNLANWKIRSPNWAYGMRCSPWFALPEFVAQSCLTIVAHSLHPLVRKDHLYSPHTLDFSYDPSGSNSQLIANLPLCVRDELSGHFLPNKESKKLQRTLKCWS